MDLTVSAEGTTEAPSISSTLSFYFQLVFPGILFYLTLFGTLNKRSTAQRSEASKPRASLEN